MKKIMFTLLALATALTACSAEIGEDTQDIAAAEDVEETEEAASATYYCDAHFLIVWTHGEFTNHVSALGYGANQYECINTAKKRISRRYSSPRSVEKVMKYLYENKLTKDEYDRDCKALPWKC